ncbi:MAG: polyprenyl synthetase family protein [Planctomycetes bacterium]|nr:polyprenyl synthetase family protein [Planctomycetota bacterium]
MPDSRAEFLQFLSTSARRVESILKKRLASGRRPKRLVDAMRYAVFGGGKRFRPGLVYLGCRAFGGDLRSVDGAAAAVEMIHTYSLVHDDLPCMDDDDLRRGRPTLHIQFDEAMAVLAGDALHTEAFATIVEMTRPEIAPEIIKVLASAAGLEGMVGGQVLDLDNERERPRASLVEKIHLGKTAALIAASLEMGAIGAGAGRADRRRIRDLGLLVGLAFQVTDDVLDVTGDAATLGKTPGKDMAAGKMTYPAAVGLARARARARELCDAARSSAKAIGTRERKLLLEVPLFVTDRTN